MLRSAQNTVNPVLGSVSGQSLFQIIISHFGLLWCNLPTPFCILNWEGCPKSRHSWCSIRPRISP